MSVYIIALLEFTDVDRYRRYQNAYPEVFAKFNGPTATALYPIVQHHLESFLARASSADPFADAVPGWVENDFRAYLRCGILAHGFARARCTDCGAERLVAFSCKGRGVCPSCNTPHGRGRRPPER